MLLYIFYFVSTNYNYVDQARICSWKQPVLSNPGKVYY